MLELSERQRQTVAAAVTTVSALVILCTLALLFWLLGSFFTRFSNVFLPIAVAGVLALVTQPYYLWLRSRLRLPTALALAAVFLSMLIPVIAFGWFFGALIVDQISDLVETLPDTWRRLRGAVEERWPPVVEFLERHQIPERLRQAVEGQEGSLVQGISSVGETALSFGRSVLRSIGAVLGWVVLPVYFVFFLMADPKQLDRLDELLPFFKPGTRSDVVYLVREFVNILVAFFRGQILVAFFQGLLFAIGFSVVGLRYGFVLGLVLGFLNIIPYLGSIVGLGLAIPLAYFQEGGGVLLVAGILVVFTIVQVIEGYLLTPKIMGDRTGLHPVAIIVAVFFWGSALNGITGMILAIPLTAFLVVFWRLLKEKYIEELV